VITLIQGRSCCVNTII